MKTSYLSELEKVISDYQVGLLRIDREHDEACDKIDKQIASILRNVSGDDSRFRVELPDEKALRQQSESIEREIADIESKITKLDLGITTVDKAIKSIQLERTSLEQQIENRCLLEVIFYSFFHDSEKDRYRVLQRKLDSKEKERVAFAQTRQEFESARDQAMSRKTDLQNQLKEINRKRTSLLQANQYADEKSKSLMIRRKEMETLREKRRSRLEKTTLLNWEKACLKITEETSKIVKQQPAFRDIGKTSTVFSEVIPKELLLGSQIAAYKNQKCRIPHSVAFPLRRALVIPEDNAAQRRLAHHLLLRLLQAIPPGRLEVVLIDPIKLGDSFSPFLPILNVAELFPQGHVLTRADEIERTLDNLSREVENLIQHRFKGRISSWFDYNTAYPESELKYKLIFIFNAPEQLSDRSLWYLERLTQNGPGCGILPVIAVEGQRIEDRKYEKFRAALKESCQRLDALVHFSESIKNGLLLSYQPDQWPEQESLDIFLSAVAIRYSETSKFKQTLPDLWNDYGNSSTTIQGFEIPIGWDESGKIVNLILGSTESEHHVLLAGKTGTGKSNLLHIIIHSLCEKYSPQEVDLYLLDYKESTEFAIYSKPPLPHARLVATESDPEYGLTVLKHLAEECARRGRLFKSVDVRDFAEYRTLHKEQLSRILIVIDEFQVLFMDDRHFADTVEQLLSQLLKQGRSFGVHVLLATQTLKGLNALSLGSLVTQAGCRIALACSQEDSAMILSMNNLEAANLKSPPEGIINNANGALSGNVKFLIPLAEREFCRKHLSTTAERAGKKNFHGKTRLFNGAVLPRRPKDIDQHGTKGEIDALLLGEQLTFGSSPLLVPLVRRQSFNVLYSGYNDVIHDGLLTSTIASISSSLDFEEIIYFNGRNIEPGDNFKDVIESCRQRFSSYSDIDSLPLQQVADNIGKRPVALIVDGFDAEKALHPVQTFSTRKPGEPLTQADLLKRIAEDGSRKGTFIFLFIDNWKRCGLSCKDLFSYFEMRVAFCMNEDDAGTLVSGGIGKFKGLEKPNRAVFVNRMTNETTWFRPYIAESGENR